MEQSKMNKEALIEWLELKYEARLKLYEGIKSDEPLSKMGYPDSDKNPPAHSVFRLTYAAFRLRTLKAAISLLKGEKEFVFLHKSISEELILEKSKLMDIKGGSSPSILFYENIICELDKM
jgi:hypothetical protein